MIIVEDGSVVDNANSYITRADAIDRAELLGVVLPDSEATDTLLIQAAQFIDAVESRLVGHRATRDQALAWPRRDVFITGFAYHTDELPALLLTVQVQLAIDLHNSIDLYNRPDRQTVTRERVDGAVEVAYATPSVVGNRVVQSPGTRLLRGLFKRGGALTIEAIRA